MDARHDAAAASRRLLPLPGRHFLVDLGAADPRDPASGFTEVVFPVFHADRDAPPRVGPGHEADTLLVLRRAATGARDLYAWWDESRRLPAPEGRTVTVQWLAPDQRTVVLTWRFTGAYPVRLSYSPLQATRDELVIESVALAFARVDMI